MHFSDFRVTFKIQQKIFIYKKKYVSKNIICLIFERLTKSQEKWDKARNVLYIWYYYY